MRRSDFKNAAIFTAVVLVIAAAFLIITLPPRRITLKDVPPAGAPQNSPKESVKQENTLADSQQTYVSKESQPGFYIIVGSFKNIQQAQQKAKELIDEYECGLLFTPDDNHELSQAILTILANKDMRKKMGENGRLAVTANYTWESVAKKLDSEYMKLV